MRFTSEAEALSRALAIVGRAVSKRSTIQLLTGILVEADAESGVVRLAATDMEVSVSLRCRAGVEEGGRAVIPAKPLLEVVRSLDPDDGLELGLTGGEATLSVGGNAFRIRHYAADDFPALPEPPAEDGAFSVPLTPLVAAVERALPFASRDESRPVLTGALLRFEDKGGGARVLVATTDSYRLSVGTAPLGGAKVPGGQEGSVHVVPARGLAELARLRASVADAVGKEAAEKLTATVSLSANRALFEVGGILLAARLIEGNFPEFARLVPPAFEREVAVDAGRLQKALRRALIFAPAGKKAGARLPVLLRLGDGDEAEPTLGDPMGGETLVVASESGDEGAAGAGGAAGGAVERVPAETLKSPEGPAASVPFAIALNGQYLSEALRACDPAAGGEGAGAEAKNMRVLLKLNGPMKPAVVAPRAADTQGAGEEDDFSVLVMPMHHKEARAAEAKLAEARAAATQPQKKEQDGTPAAEPDDGADGEAEQREAAAVGAGGAE